MIPKMNSTAVIGGEVGGTLVTSAAQEDLSGLIMAYVLLNNWTPVVYTPFGLFGNIMTYLISLRKENSKISTCVYMRALSIVDTIALVGNLFYRALFGHGLGVDITDRKFSLRWV